MVNPPPMNSASGGGKFLRAAGASRNNREVGCPQGHRIVRDVLESGGMGFDGNGPTASITAHPLNANRATTGPHIPEQLPWHRGQGSQRHGADFAFGQLSVVVIGSIW